MFHQCPGGSTATVQARIAPASLHLEGCDFGNLHNLATFSPQLSLYKLPTLFWIWSLVPSSLLFLLYLGLTDEDQGGRSIFSKEGTWQELGHLMRCRVGAIKTRKL